MESRGQLAAEVKAKMLSQNLDNYVCKIKLDLQRMPRSYDPTYIFFFEVPQEYLRALNAPKWNMYLQNHSLLSWMVTEMESVAWQSIQKAWLLSFLGHVIERLEFGTCLNENASVQYKHMRVLYKQYVLTFMGLLFLLLVMTKL